MKVTKKAKSLKAECKREKGRFIKVRCKTVNVSEKK